MGIKYRWKFYPAFESASGASAQKPVSLCSQLLLNRGIATQEAQTDFLSADERLLQNPFILPDMSRAIKRLSLALKNKETIGIYGDFDADGICGTALLAEGLKSLGAAVIPYLPHRVEDGYGLNSRSLNYLKQCGVHLVVSVDCGITAFVESEEARNLGMDLIITDHHRPIDSKQQSAVEARHAVPSTEQTADSKQQTANLPQALAVIDPWRSDSLYPFPQLSGTGVAYKLFQALCQAVDGEAPSGSILELVAIATVADMQPLMGENRYLVKKGLEELNHTARPGLQALIKTSGLVKGKIDSEDLSWVLGPRLNAAGRVEHALLSYKLLLSQTREEAEARALELEKLNDQRQKLTAETYEKAREQVVPGSPLIFVQGDFPQGVIGIVAGRLSREFYRPALVIQEGEKNFHGSARSIVEFDLVSALSGFKDLLERFGGHPRAAGFALAPDKVKLFREGILKMAEDRLAGQELTPAILIDAIFPISQADGSTFTELEKLEPFGLENTRPVFLSRNVSLLEDNRMGKNGDHLKLKLKDGDKVITAVGFNFAREMPRMATSTKIDLVYSLKKDSWQGVETIRPELLDLDYVV